MADTIELNAGSGGAIIATDDVAGVHYQRVKLDIGGDAAAQPVTGGNGAADAGTLRVTVASDSTGVLSVDDNGGAITVDNAGTFAVQDSTLATNTTDLPNVIGTDGSAGPTKCLSVGGTQATGELEEVRVDADGHLQVDVLSGGGAGTQYNEDEASPAVITGNALMMERDDALATLTPVEADWAAARCSATGALWTAVDGVVSIDDNAGAITVDNAGTFAVQVDGSALTALQLLDDIVHVDDTATHATGTTKGALLMAAATPTDGSVDANDIGAVAMSLDRRLLVDAQIVGTDAALDCSGATVTVTGTVTADWAGTAPPIGAGVEATALRVTLATDSTGVVSIDDNAGSLTVDNAGTFAVQVDAALPAGTNAIGKLAANDGVDIGDVTVNNTVTVDLGANNDVQGADAHDAATSGNPFLAAGRAANTVPTAVSTDGDVTHMMTDDFGRLVTVGSPRDLVAQNSNTISNNTEATLLAAGAAGIFRDLTMLVLSNNSATKTRVIIRDASEGTTRLQLTLAADGGGAVMKFDPPFKHATAATAWFIDTDQASTTIDFSVQAIETK